MHTEGMHGRKHAVREQQCVVHHPCVTPLSHRGDLERVESPPFFSVSPSFRPHSPPYLLIDPMYGVDVSLPNLSQDYSTYENEEFSFIPLSLSRPTNLSFAPLLV